MNIPKELKYTKDHEWVRIESEYVVIGVTDFAQKELGDIVYVDIDTEGDIVQKEEVFGAIEAVKTVSDLLMPITGEVISFNEDLENTPEMVNNDPYGKGWMIKVVVSDSSQVSLSMCVPKYDICLTMFTDKPHG